MTKKGVVKKSSKKVLRKSSKKKIINFEDSNVYLEMYKNVANITETLVHFKDILRALGDIGTKTSADVQVMNAKWNSIKDKVEDIFECIDEIQKNTTTLLTQMDLKEKERFVAKLNANNKEKEKKKIQLVNIYDFVTKNFLLIVVVIIIIIGLALVANGTISGETYWNGLTGDHLPKIN